MVHFAAETNLRPTDGSSHVTSGRKNYGFHDARMTSRWREDA
jgi:hypothetical protein